MKPDISIIIPAYNAEETLTKTLDSIKNQTFQNFELILVDDGSTDQTAQVFLDQCYGDSRYQYYYQENAGQGAARNLAVEKAKGDYLCFIDADDLVSENYLEGLLNKAKESGAQIVLSDMFELHKDNLKIPISQRPREGSRLGYIMPTYPAKLFRTDFFRDNFVEQPRMKFEDLATVPYYLYIADKIEYVRGIGYYYYQNPNSTVNNIAYFEDRQKSLYYLCDLFQRKGILEQAREDIHTFLKLRYLADKTKFETMIPLIYKRCEVCINQFLGEKGSDMFVNFFMVGSYNLYRAIKYVRGCLIDYRFMATTVESIVGSVNTQLRDCRIERVTKLRKENVISDCTKQFMNVNPADCDDISLFIFDLMDERFDVAYDGETCFTLSDAYLESPEIMPVCRKRLSERLQDFSRDFHIFYQKLKSLAGDKKIIMVRMLLAEQYGDEEHREYFDEIDEIREINRQLNQLYDSVEAAIPEIITISVEEMEEYYTDREFRYGCYPWHLNELVYSEIGKKIAEKCDE